MPNERYYITKDMMFLHMDNVSLAADEFGVILLQQGGRTIDSLAVNS